MRKADPETRIQTYGKDKGAMHEQASYGLPNKR